DEDEDEDSKGKGKDSKGKDDILDANADIADVAVRYFRRLAELDILTEMLLGTKDNVDKDHDENNNASREGLDAAAPSHVQRRSESDILPETLSEKVHSDGDDHREPLERNSGPTRYPREPVGGMSPLPAQNSQRTALDETAIASDLRKAAMTTLGGSFYHTAEKQSLIQITLTGTPPADPASHMIREVVLSPMRHPGASMAPRAIFLSPSATRNILANTTSQHHWELGYKVEQECIACQDLSTAPLALVCQCSRKHAICARHLDLFHPQQGHGATKRDRSEEADHANRNKRNKHELEIEVHRPQSRRSSGISYSDGLPEIEREHQDFGKIDSHRDIGIQADHLANDSNAPPTSGVYYDARTSLSHSSLELAPATPSPVTQPALQANQGHHASSFAEGADGSPQPPGALVIVPRQPPSPAETNLSDLSSFPSSQPLDLHLETISNIALPSDDIAYQISDDANNVSVAELEEVEASSGSDVSMASC
ncbi:hypothetical protein FRB90_006236, partial [Tulasnella sp. 427]